MYLKGNRLVLHIIDNKANFSAAKLLSNCSAENIWRKFILCWASIYAGYPDIFKADQGSEFTFKAFIDYSNMTGMKLDLSGVESLNYIGSGENYHSP